MRHMLQNNQWMWKKTQTYHKPIKIISDWKSFPNTQVSDLLDIDNTISM